MHRCGQVWIKIVVCCLMAREPEWIECERRDSRPPIHHERPASGHREKDEGDALHPSWRFQKGSSARLGRARSAVRDVTAAATRAVPRGEGGVPVPGSTGRRHV